MFQNFHVFVFPFRENRMGVKFYTSDNLCQDDTRETNSMSEGNVDNVEIDRRPGQLDLGTFGYRIRGWRADLKLSLACRHTPDIDRNIISI